MEIYEHDMFVNASYPYLFNKEIIEYDMREAGFSLIKEYKLVNEATIDKLSKLKKDYRTVYIGKMEQKDKVLAKKKAEAFVEARRLFFGANQLTDADVLSIKKDAIFIIRPGGVSKQKFGSFIDFRKKNQYSSYIRFPKRIEVYYSPTGTDVKGLGKSSSLHESYMTDFLNRFCKRMESEPREDVISFIKRFVDKYKHRQLDVGYYREYNPVSEFIGLNGDKYDEYYLSLEDLDITYNFYNILMKVVQIPV